MLIKWLVKMCIYSFSTIWGFHNLGGKSYHVASLFVDKILEQAIQDYYILILFCRIFEPQPPYGTKRIEYDIRGAHIFVQKWNYL